jgi:hypothetical protein
MHTLSHPIPWKISIRLFAQLFVLVAFLALSFIVRAEQVKPAGQPPTPTTQQ